jgi:hypothetical protein
LANGEKVRMPVTFSGTVTDELKVVPGT